MNHLVLSFILTKQPDFPFRNLNSINQLLRNFFMEIRKIKGSYNPGELFSGLCKRNPRFNGF